MVAKLPKNSNISPEQNKQFATETLTWMQQPENKALLQGAQEYKDGNINTPGAKQFAAELDKRRGTFIEEQMAKATAADPAAASTPQGWGGMLQQATASWEQMPTEMKLVMGLGLGGGLLGMASSIFGEGGMGMGLLGLLGLGAAGLTGAAGGMFGPNAQQGVSDAAYNLGSFFGAVPDAGSMKGKFTQLKDPNAVAALSAPPTASEQNSAFWNPQAAQARISEQVALAEKAKNFAMVPENMRVDWVRKMDPSLTPEEAGVVATNLIGLSNQMNDPQSALAKKLQSAHNFAGAKDPGAYVTQQAVNSAVNTGRNAWNSASNAVSDAWNGARDYLTKKNEDMTIYRLIEKWAFNDVDAKELSDLKTEQAKGAPYRVEDARREQELEMRRQAETSTAKQPVSVKKVTVVACSKSAATSPAWQRAAGKNDEGGLNAKGRASYNKATGGHLKAPVTESNPTGERDKRQNSFCSRMCGMKKHETGSETKKDPDSRINKSLRKWNCKCSAAEEFGAKIARCWTGYEPVPGKKPYSNDSCRPVGSKKKKKETKKK